MYIVCLLLFVWHTQQLAAAGNNRQRASLLLLPVVFTYSHYSLLVIGFVGLCFPFHSVVVVSSSADLCG